MTRALAILILALGVPAAAQPKPKTAEEHYEASRRYYDVDEFDKAIAELKEAYTLSPDPAYLFNIAQAMRKKGDCAGAIDYYRKYLRGSPNAQNKVQVEDTVKELEANPATCKKVEVKPVDPKPVDPKPVDPKPVDPKPKNTAMVEKRPITGPERAPQETGRGLRIAAYATGGVGLLILAGGTFFALDARSLSNKVESECNADAGCDWAVRGKDDDRGRSRATLSKIAFGAGALAVGGGVVMYMLSRPSRESRVAFVPTADGALVVANGRF